MAADFIIVAFFILFIIIGTKRGFARSVLGIINLVLSFLVSRFIAGFLADFLYDVFIKQTVVENINNYISTKGADYALAKGLSALPDWAEGIVSGVVGFLGTNFQQLEQTLREGADYAVSNTVASIENSIRTVSVAVFGLILLIIIFIVFYFLVRKLMKIVLNLFKLPIIKQVNSVLGGIFGGIEGIIFILIAVNIFAIITAISDPSLLQHYMINGWIFNWICIK